MNKNNILSINVPLDYSNILRSLDATNVKEMSVVKEIINNFFAAVDSDIKTGAKRDVYNFKMAVAFDKDKNAKTLSYADDVIGIDPNELGECIAFRHPKGSTGSFKNEHNNGLNLAIVKTSSGLENDWKIVNIHKHQKMVVTELGLGLHEIEIEQTDVASGLELWFENPKFDLFSPNLRHNSKFFGFLNKLGSDYGLLINQYEKRGITINIYVEYTYPPGGTVSKRVRPITCPIINPDNQESSFMLVFPVETNNKKGLVKVGYKKEPEDSSYKENIYGSVHPHKVSNTDFGADIYLDDIKICGGFDGMELLGMSTGFTRGGNQGLHNRLYIEVHLEPTDFSTTNTKDGINTDTETRKWFDKVREILIGKKPNPQTGKAINYMSRYFTKRSYVKEKAKQDKIYSQLADMSEYTGFHNISRERHTETGGRLDISYFDRNNNLYVHEIKNGPAKREHINQCMGYAIELLREREGNVYLTLICDDIDEKMVMLKDRYLERLNDPRLSFKIEKLSESKMFRTLFQY